MKIKQYVYFALRSDVLRPDDIAQRIGLAPDSEVVRGSRQSNPPRPVSHAWKIECDEKGLGIGEQVADVMARVMPCRAAIRELVESGEAHAALQLVRYFGVYEAVDDGEEEEITETPEGLVKLAGQHQLLGWHLDHDVLAFLSEVGAELDADEYG